MKIKIKRVKIKNNAMDSIDNLVSYDVFDFVWDFVYKSVYNSVWRPVKNFVWNSISFSFIRGHDEN